MKSLVQGSTAYQCGQVRVGDEIIAVDGLSVSHDSLAELAQKILGEAGSKVCICRRANLPFNSVLPLPHASMEQ